MPTFPLDVAKISFIHHIGPGVHFRCVIIENVSLYTRNSHRATKAPWYKSKATYDDHGALVALCGFRVYATYPKGCNKVRQVEKLHIFRKILFVTGIFYSISLICFPSAQNPIKYVKFIFLE